MAAPAWLGATAKNGTLPGQVNQFLTSHSSNWIFTGSQQSAQATGSGLYQSTQSLYLAQTFTTGSSQTTLGQVLLQISAVGGSPVNATITPLTVSLYASQLGAPTGSALASTQVVEPYVYASGFWVSIPLQATGLTASTPYWIVTSLAGTSSAYYVWQESNQTSGAATAPDGVTWTTVPYGLMYEVYDGSTGTGQIQGFQDDGGARTVTFTWNSVGQLTGLTEWTQTQGGGALTSTRSISYSSGFITGVS